MPTTPMERELEMRLLLSPEYGVPVPARPTCLADAPCAVHVAFPINSGQPVRRTFARELPVEGVFRPCGHGEVRVWPSKAGGRGVVLRALSGPGGDALPEAPPVPVAAWPERTLRAVPPGTGAARLGLDDGPAGLFAR